MTQAELNAIRTRCENATPWPKIGERIRSVRNEKKWTQKKLGEECGIAEPTIRKYELGMLNPKIETLQKIADALGTSISYLRNEPCADNANSAILRKALEIAADERGTPIPGWDKQKIMDRWIKKAEALK